MENKIIVIKDGKELRYDLPAYGEVNIQVVNWKPVGVNITNKEKI